MKNKPMQPMSIEAAKRMFGLSAAPETDQEFARRIGTSRQMVRHWRINKGGQVSARFSDRVRLLSLTEGK